MLRKRHLDDHPPYLHHVISQLFCNRNILMMRYKISSDLLNENYIIIHHLSKFCRKMIKEKKGKNNSKYIDSLFTLRL